MNPEAFKLTYAFDNDFVILNWTRLPYVPDSSSINRYPEVKMRFNYRDIARDTVIVMLRDLEVPAPVSKSILTYIAANAAKKWLTNISFGTVAGLNGKSAGQYQIGCYGCHVQPA